LFFKNEKRASEDVNINTPATHTDENNKEEEKLDNWLTEIIKTVIVIILQ